jgi:hypothetical protein
MANDALIDRLVLDLEPVPVLRPARIIATLIAMIVILSLLCVLVLGPRIDLIGMLTTPVLLLRNLLLLWLGAGAARAVIGMAYPQNSGNHRTWRWLLLSMAGGVVVATTVALPDSVADFMARLYAADALWCVGITLIAATSVSAVLAYWLRRGAATDLNRAAWLTGISGGAFGALAFSWHCPHEDPLYIGLWYAVAVVTAAGLTRLWVKPVIRW